MGWPCYSFGDLGSIGYEHWGIWGFPNGSGTTRSPGLVLKDDSKVGKMSAKIGQCADRLV